MKYKKTTSALVSMFMLVSIAMLVALVSASGGIGGFFSEDTSVIYGSASADNAAATSMQTYLETFGPISLNTTIISGELAPIKTSSQPLYLNDMMRDTKSTFTDNELPTVLASGEVDDFDYDLKIEVPETSVVYDTTTDDFDTPVINADFDNDGSYNFRVIFPVAVDISDLEGESIVLFGKKYQFSEDDLDSEELILFEDREVIYVQEGTPQIVNGKSIEALVKGKDSVRLTIDGESQNVDDGWSGEIGGLDVTIKDITFQEFSGGMRLVDLYIDSQKLVLSHDDEVELGGENIDGTSVEIKNQGDDKIREIVITVTPSQFDDEIEYLELEDYFIDPVFGTVKFSLDTISPELKSDDKDFIEIKTSGDDSAKIEFINKAGGEYNFEFIEDNVVTFMKETIQEDQYFITGNNEYTQIWEVENIDAGDEKEIRLRDMAKDSDPIEVKFTGESGEFTLADGSVATISSVTPNSIQVSNIADYLYTEKGAMISFDFGIITETEEVCSNYTTSTMDPSTCLFNVTLENWTCGNYTEGIQNDSSCHDIVINTEITASKIIITEETKYNGGSFTDNDGNELGSEITISIENLNDDNEDLKLELDSGFIDDDDNRYFLTNYGTYFKEFDGEKVEIYYPEEAMEIDFNIGEIESKVTTVSDDISNILKITDASTSTSQDTIVVGGPCINTLAAQLLGGKYCGNDFTVATGVGAGKAMIQVFVNPNNVEGKAILVAGYEAVDTNRAIDYLKSNEFDLTIGSKIII